MIARKNITHPPKKPTRTGEYQVLCKRHALLLLATSILNACAKYAAEETVTGTKQETHSINAERSPQFICLPEDSIIVRELQVENRHKRAEPMEPISRFACFEKTLQLIADLEYIAANTPQHRYFDQLSSHKNRAHETNSLKIQPEILRTTTMET